MSEDDAIEIPLQETIDAGSCFRFVAKTHPDQQAVTKLSLDATGLYVQTG